ncbi:conserved hypothetical protein [Acidothermus cellulolyticus 11B]|uniref:Peptidase M24 domain-containing protein n=1 Tax=Acidothermus cellulolyticus (strain ATCC 43068 / DSM 8971 / 11B) TaxID=351607 RepID=A0LRZ5_ACIC1|nr:M24 family metallopeptidase [Acidothermus cellulolyticus]ABK52205.1 conserved hypothetical protein [Acidothermus cellulolyticus 11B]
MDVNRATAAAARLAALREHVGVPGIVLTTPGNVAWLTGGANTPIDRGATTDVIWAVATPDHIAIITTEVEAPRLADEAAFGSLGWPIHAVPWWEPAMFVAKAEAIAGVHADRLAADGHPAFGLDLAVHLVRTRMALTPPDVAALARLGTDAAAAVSAALRAWQPGDTDRTIAARIAADLEEVGAFPTVLLVGGDDRLQRYRHPVTVGAPLHDVVMTVLVAVRGGLHVALTRYAARTPPPTEWRDRLNAVRRIHRAVLDACWPGRTVGAALQALAAAYAAEGAPDAWRQHYQGGPIAYAQREYELAPVQTTDQWWSHVLTSDTAVAWNPSLPGGAKDEDTYLITPAGPRLLTTCTEWPMTNDDVPRPDVWVIDGTPPSGERQQQPLPIGTSPP